MSARARRWLLLAGWILVLAALALFVQRTLKVSTDLRSFMPPARTADQKLIMEQIGEGPGSRLLLVAIAGVEATRRLAAGRFEWTDGTHLFPMEHPDETARLIRAAIAGMMPAEAAG